MYHRIRSLTQYVGAVLWSMAQIRRGHLRMVVLLRPLPNNTNTPCQCSYSNYCSVRLPVSTSSHGSYIVTSVISYYSCMQQGVDKHSCLVTIYSLFTDTGQEVLAPTVSTHNRHQLSHQLSVVTASTVYVVGSC